MKCTEESPIQSDAPIALLFAEYHPKAMWFNEFTRNGITGRNYYCPICKNSWVESFRSLEPKNNAK